MNINPFLAIFSAILILATPLYGTSRPDSTSIGVEISTIFRGGPVLPSNPMVKGENAFGERMRSVLAPDLRLSFRLPATSGSAKLYPYAYQGFGIGSTNFIPHQLSGSPVNIYVMQGYRIASLSDRLSLDYEWNFGASFGWNKINENQPTLIDEINGFGSSVNAYINLAFILKYRLSDRWALTCGIDFSHFSNGNTSYPNPGVNVIWGRIGAIYTITPSSSAHTVPQWQSFRPHWVCDLTLYGAWKKGTFSPDVDEPAPMYYVIPGHFGVGGVSVNPLYRFNPLFSAGASLDAQYDESAGLSSRFVTSSSIYDPYFYRPSSFLNQCMIGLSLRAELTMPIFSVNIGIGHTLAAPDDRNIRGFYQTFTLKTFISKNLYLNTGYRLIKFKTPGNLMLGAGFRFNLR